MRICSRLQMDLSNKVSSLERFGMIDPDQKVDVATARTLAQINDYSWEANIYPHQPEVGEDGVPRCIFVPD